MIPSLGRDGGEVGVEPALDPAGNEVVDRGPGQGRDPSGPPWC